MVANSRDLREVFMIVLSFFNLKIKDVLIWIHFCFIGCNRELTFHFKFIKALHIFFMGLIGEGILTWSLLSFAWVSFKTLCFRSALRATHHFIFICQTAIVTSFTTFLVKPPNQLFLGANTKSRSWCLVCHCHAQGRENQLSLDLNLHPSLGRSWVLAQHQSQFGLYSMNRFKFSLALL